MGSETYQAIIFRQRDQAPVQLAFVAASTRIDLWARVPTKRTGNIRNFQRAEIPTHIKEVGRFFTNDRNASPTAVVVGFDPIRSHGRVTVQGSDGQPLDLDTVTPAQAMLGQVEIQWVEDADPSGKEALTKH